MKCATVPKLTFFSPIKHTLTTILVAHADLDVAGRSNGWGYRSRVSGNREWVIRAGAKKKSKKKGLCHESRRDAGSGQDAGGATRRDCTRRPPQRHEPTNPVARAPCLHAVAMPRWTEGMPAWRLVAGIWVSCLRVSMLQKLLENLRRDVVAPFWR